MAEWLVEAVARTPQSSGPPILTVLGPITFVNMSIVDELNADGSAALSCAVDRLSPDIKNHLRDLAATPLEIHVRRGDQVMFAGPVWSWQLSGGTLTINTRGLGGYLRYMQVDGDTGDLDFVNTDQHTVMAGLIDAWQDLDYGHYGIDTSSVGLSGRLRTRHYVASERHVVYQRVVELADVGDGSDWRVDPATRMLVLSYPEQGTDLSGSVHLDDRNIMSSDESASVTPDVLASVSWGVSSSTESVLTSQQTNTALRETFGRAGVSLTFDGVTNQSTLDDHTVGALDARGGMHRIPGPQITPVLEADVDSFSVGDRVRYTFDAGLGVVDTVARVVRQRVSVSATGVEEMAVELA